MKKKLPPIVSASLTGFRAVAIEEVWGSRFAPEGRHYRHRVYAVGTAEEMVQAIRNPPHAFRYCARYLAGPGGKDSRVKVASGETWIARGRVPRGHQPAAAN